MLKLITATELKLHKAKYYLRRMKETKDNSYYLDFLCELESFLMHARSITNLPAARKKDSKGNYRDSWFLEQELGQKPDFESWYDQKVLELQSDAIMHFLHDERDIAVHYNYSDIHYRHDSRLSITEHLSVSDSIKITVHHEDSTDEVAFESPPEPPRPTRPTEVTVEHIWFFDTNRFTGNKEVIPVCEYYLETLEKLLEDCRKQGFL